MRVLYVDDDRINTLLFEETCRHAGGLDLRCAGSGGEALEVAAEFVPELLVLDLHLPDTNGYALLPQLRAATGRADAPAFLCSADEPSLLAQQARDAGFQGCWAKPIDLQVVLTDLARLGGAAEPGSR